MTLLLNTDIEMLVHERIRGRVARAGGTMNQLMTYDGCRVDDINLIDGGFGAIDKIASVSGVRTFLRVMRHYWRQEMEFRRQGPRFTRDRKVIPLDMHEAARRPRLRGVYDAAVSSNMIEHSPNPVWLLLNFHFITKHNGYQFHAIPHCRHTYDRFRQPTPLGHFVEDFEAMTGPDDTSHNEDYIQSAIVKDGWQKEFHQRYPVAYPFMHFHVFDEYNTRELLEFMFEDVVNDVIKTEEFSDNVVLFRNALNPMFSKKYQGLIQQYMQTDFLRATGHPKK